MVQCFASGCDHRSDDSQGKCKVNIQFPVQAYRRNKWILAVRRADEEPSESSRLCTCHFQDGNFDKPPSIFAWNQSKSFNVFKSPEKKIIRKRRGVTSKLPLEEPDLPHEDTPQCSFSNGNTLLSEGKWSHPEVYEAELYFKDKEIEALKEKIRLLTIQNFSYKRITNDQLCEHYTGLDRKMFDLMVILCQLLPVNHYKGKPVHALLFEDKVLLTLMKLRLNSSYLDLGVRFGISTSTAFKIVYAILPLLHQVVYQSVMEKIPSQKKNRTSMPSSFQSFSTCRIVVDCTEIQCEIPKSMQKQKMTWSSYKKRNTVKILTAVAPNASITFCSDAYPGSVSDKEIVKHCEILNQLEAGDLVLADKGFLLYDVLPPSVSLNIPPFLYKPQFTSQEVEETRNIAKARIHIERANYHIKRYRILTLIPHSLFSRISMVIQTCVGLVNFKNPLLKCMAQDFLVSEGDSDLESAIDETDAELSDIEIIESLDEDNN